MKSLLAGIVLIVVLGIGGLLYRNALEHPVEPAIKACTLDAKICPDGTTVGRSGPSCEFTACPPPNVSIDSIGIAFAVPEGYVENKNAVAPETAMVAAYEKTGTSTPPDAIVIYRYPIPEGQTANDVILANTFLEPSDMQPKDMNAFRPRIIGTRTFVSIVIERFEAVVHSAYYLPREHDVLRFDVLEHNVMDWSDNDLIPSNLPEHQALAKMLGTLSLTEAPAEGPTAGQ
jgi:hypothetical protein